MKNKASDIFCNVYEEYKLSQEQIDTLYPWIKNSVYLYEYFKLTELQIKPLTDSNIFHIEDFKTSDDFIHRTPINLKLGPLLIEFSNQGKGSFELTIQFIHYESRELTTFLHFSGRRYPELIFSDIMPYHLDCTATWIKPKAKPDSPIMHVAHRLRSLITQLALGKIPTPSEFKGVFLGFVTHLNPNFGLFMTKTYLRTKELMDVDDFLGESFLHHPRNTRELAAKLACSFFSHFGVNMAQIKPILQDYVTHMDLNPATVNKEWIDEILDIAIDHGQYNLRTIFPHEFCTIQFRQVIEQIHDEYKTPSPT